MCVCLWRSHWSALRVVPQVSATLFGDKVSHWTANTRGPLVCLWDYRTVLLHRVFFFFLNMASEYQIQFLIQLWQAVFRQSHLPGPLLFWRDLSPTVILMGSLFLLAMGQVICSVFLELVLIICATLGICLPKVALFIGDSCSWFGPQSFSSLQRQLQWPFYFWF